MNWLQQRERDSSYKLTDCYNLQTNNKCHKCDIYSGTLPYHSSQDVTSTLSQGNPIIQQQQCSIMYSATIVLRKIAHYSGIILHTPIILKICKHIWDKPTSEHLFSVL